MKKHIISPILGFFALSFFTACGDDDFNQTDFTHPVGGNQITLNCQSELDENKITWKADSKIGFFCEQTNSKNLTVGLAAPFVGKTEGVFYTKVVWKKGEQHTLYAYTPYNKSNVSEKSIAGTLSNSQSQNGVSKDHLTSSAITYSVVKTAEVADAIPMIFKHALGYLDLRCTTADTFVGWKIKSIELSTNDNTPLAGKYQFDMTTEKLSFTEGFDKIVLRTNNATEITANEAFHGYLSVNPIDLTDKKCNIKIIIEKAEELDRQLNGIVDGIRIEPSRINAMDINIDNLEAEFLEDQSIDLSKDETANCYVAGKAGQEYRFNATVMGNGATTPAGSSANYKGIIPTPLSPVSAAILWQSERNLLTGVKLKNDCIYFTLNGSKDIPLKPGNAVIAAYDANGIIVWSWHIWVTDVDLDAKAQTYTNIHKDYSAFPKFQSPVVMDRNLGATDNEIWTSATDSKGAHGLFYQWGRKDPIIGPSTESANAFATIYDGNNNLTSFDFTATELIKRDDIAKYPMKYIKGDNWFAEDAYDLWGNSAAYTANGGDGSVGSKSIYDPCPPGYRVPHPYIWSGFTSAAIGGKHKGGTVTATASGDITKQGGVTFDNGGPVIYPSTGFINQGALQRVAPAGNGCISLWSNAGAKAKFSSQFYYDATNCNTPKANKRTFGFGVRCIRDIQK